jgi:hypothetical protein
MARPTDSAGSGCETTVQAEGDRASLFRDFTIDSMRLDLAITSAGLDGKFVEVGFSDGIRPLLCWLAAWLCRRAAVPESEHLAE